MAARFGYVADGHGEIRQLPSRRIGAGPTLSWLGHPEPDHGFFKRDLFIGSREFNSEKVDNRSVSYVLDHSFAPNWLFHSAFRYYETDSTFRAVGVTPDPALGFPPFALPPGNFYVYPFTREQSSQALLADNHVEGRFNTGFIEHNIVAGVDYQNYKRRNVQFLGTYPGSPFDPFNPVNITNINPLTFPDHLRARQLGEQTGVYLQDQMKVGGFILTGSVRHDWFNSSLLTDSNYIQPNPLLPPGTPERLDIKALSYRGAIGYDFGIGVVPYVAYSTSFSPQISGFVINPGGGTSPLDPIEGRQIEGGLKYQPPGSNALYTFSGFEITQSNVGVPDPNPRNAGAQIQLGETKATGFELEGKHSFDNGVSIIAGYTYLETEITKDNRTDPFGGRSFVGFRLANVPKNAFSLFVDYQFPEDSFLAGLRAGGGVRYIGERTNIFNLDSLPGYALVDASISYDLARLDPSLKGFTASAFGTNLFDQRYFSPGFYPLMSRVNGQYSGSVLEGYRRAVYGQLTYRW